MYLIEDEDEIPAKIGNTRESNHSPTVPKKAAAIDMEAFNRAFRLVVRHYQCPANEIAAMKTIALANVDDAANCYLALERQILGGAQGINERIRADMAKQKGGK
jgi:hypothetical protein